MTEDLKKTDVKHKKRKRPWWKRILRVLGWIILVLVLLISILILFIRSSWGQHIIVDKLTHFVSEKTHTKVSIDKLFITFTGDIDLEGLYLEDTKGDTLIYSKKLQVDIPLWPIIRGNPISIDGLKWSGLRANIVRKDSLEGFNYQFIIDAFASDSKPKEVDTTKSDLPKIAVGSIDFADFKLNFDDAVTGMKANLELGKFHLEGKNIDLKKMKFQVADISLENTKVSYIQRKPSAPSDTTASVKPYLSLDHLKLKNVVVLYQSDPDSLVADLKIQKLILEVPKIDLSKQEIVVDQFILNNSIIKLKSNAHKNPKPVEDKTSPELMQEFIWPNWNINVTSISLQNNHIHFQVGEKSTEIKGFNPDYIVLSNFTFKANDIELSKKQTAKLQIKQFSFYESSGLTLSQLAFSAKLNPTEFSLKDLELKALNSSLNTDIKAQFGSINKLIQKPEESFLTLDLKQFAADLNDVFVFLPSLRENEYLTKLAKHKFTGKIKAKGKLNHVNLSTFEVNWGQNTSIKTHGELMNLADFDNFATDIDNFTFNTTRTDISNFVSEKDLGISIPETVLLQTQLSGQLDNFKAKVQLIIPEGKVNINGEFKKQNEIAFKADVNVVNLNLGKILKNPKIGSIALDLKAAGNGNNINDLNATLSSNFSKLEFNGYDFSALQLDGKIYSGKGNVTLKYKDENLDLLVDSRIELDSVAPKIEVDFNLIGADFYALGVTDKQIKAKLILNANFKGNKEVFDFNSHITEGIAVYDESNYHLGTVDIAANVTADSTAMDINSNFINLKLRANADIKNITEAVKHHLMGYFSDSSLAHVDAFSHPVMLQMNMKLSESKLITDFLVPDIKTMDTLILNVDFNQKEQTLTSNFSLPYIDYADKTIDSLQMKFNSTESEATFKFGFEKLNAKPFVMNRTFLDGDLKNGVLKLNFNAYDGEKEMYVVLSEISGKSSNLKIHFNPEKLIFNNEPWTVPTDNQITFSNKQIDAQNLVFSKNGESITIANDLMGTTGNNIGIGFENFKLANLFALFNKDSLLVSGDLQGDIVAINPFENLGLKADLNIDNLAALNAPLGKLTLKAQSKKAGNYDLDLGIKGDDVDLSLKGDFSAQRIGSELDFKLDLNKIGMQTIAKLSGDNLKDATGDISGEMAIHGSVSSPKYEGYLQFNNAAFNVSKLNSKFRLANDKIKIDNTLITLDQFSIEDEQNNTFTLNGNIKTESFSDPEFNMSLKANNFQALNSTEKDNDLYYGKVNFDIDGTIKGNLSLPKVNVTLQINKSTDFTYVIPESQAKLEKRDGIVEFVNKENPDDILTRTNDSSVVAILGGIELSAKLKIDKGAVFNVIIDPSTGDNLQVSGEADLDFEISKNGRMTMTGRYDIKKGHYQLSLYNLVKRKFELQPGSSIVWQGDLLDADINVTAIYKVEASASGLMAMQTSGASEELQNKYRQQLPFEVYLNVKGELDKPSLNFSLDMPEESRGAIDGTVYSRIKQLNGEEDELNKQVFSLLVLKKFYPNGGSDGSEGGAENLVRKKVNEALSDQLNAFSNKLMGKSGIELDFGLNSYTDYQGESVQQRTDLKVSAQKKLLNDRLIIQVGTNVNVEGDKHPGEENPVVGNASIQYLLTKDGRWRLKGFRNNEYENVIDGQVYINGLSVIFQRQFNKWKEIFTAPPKVEETKDETKDTEVEQNKTKNNKKAKKNVK